MKNYLNKPHMLIFCRNIDAYTTFLCAVCPGAPSCPLRWRAGQRSEGSCAVGLGVMGVVSRWIACAAARSCCRAPRLKQDKQRHFESDFPPPKRYRFATHVLRRRVKIVNPCVFHSFCFKHFLFCRQGCQDRVPFKWKV